MGASSSAVKASQAREETGGASRGAGRLKSFARSAVPDFPAQHQRRAIIGNGAVTTCQWRVRESFFLARLDCCSALCGRQVGEERFCLVFSFCRTRTSPQGFVSTSSRASKRCPVQNLACSFWVARAVAFCHSTPRPPLKQQLKEGRSGKKRRLCHIKEVSRVATRRSNPWLVHTWRLVHCAFSMEDVKCLPGRGFFCRAAVKCNVSDTHPS